MLSQGGNNKSVIIRHNPIFFIFFVSSLTSLESCQLATLEISLISKQQIVFVKFQEYLGFLHCTLGTLRFQSQCFVQNSSLSFLNKKESKFFLRLKQVEIKPLNFAYKRLLNKPYENEVILTGQNPPLKCCQSLDFYYSCRSKGLKVAGCQTLRMF